MSHPPVLFEERDAGGGLRVGFATLHRQRLLNALNLEMCVMMLDQLRRWASDESIAAVVLEGAGEKGFCAGGDVAEVVRHVRAGGPQRFVYGDAFFEVEYELDLLIHRYPKPLMSYSHGVCMGGGLGLVAGASHRVVADQSRIAMPEIHIGLFPDVAGGWFLNRVPGGAGIVMALTGMTINEADAIHAGLADFFVPQEAREELYAKVIALAWSGDAVRDRDALTRLLLSQHRRFKAGLPLCRLQQYAEAIRFIAQQPTVEEIGDCLRAAADEDPWFGVPAASLSNGSPTGAKVCAQYLRRTRTMSLDQVLALDLVLARQFQRRHDFPEGVRALLIDKDRSPAWQYSSMAQVPDEEVAGHFV